MTSPEATQTIEPIQAHARRSLRAWLLFAVPAIAGVAADLWTKAYAFPADAEPFIAGRHGFDPPAAIIPGVLSFRTTVNFGAVFGLGQHKGIVFIAFSLLALGAIVWVFLSSKRNQSWTHLALGLILGGAIGNLYDRIAYGFVRDFMIFNVRWYPYIFNVADVLLCIGVPLLMICWLFAPAPPSGKPDQAAQKDSAGTAK